MATLGTAEKRKGGVPLLCLRVRGQGSLKWSWLEPDSDYSLQAQSRPRLTAEIIAGYFGHKTGMSDERSSGRQARAGSLAQEGPRLWHWERQGGCRRSPCADLLCAGPRGGSQGLPWGSIIDSCSSESSGMGAVPAPFFWGAQGGSHEGAHWCLVRLKEGTFQGSGKGRSYAAEAGAHHTLLWFAIFQ